jgi:membrane protein DedA with SNARE-associated domain
MFSILSTESVSALLISYRYLILFPICVIEGPVATIIAGFLTSLGYFNLIIVYIIAFTGDIIGDLIYYAVGRWGSERILSRGRFLGISVENAKKLESHFQDHAGKTLLFGKWTHSVGGAILLAGGMAKVPLKKFIWYNSIGSIPKVLVFLALGYYFGSAYSKINKYFGYASLAIFIGIVLLAAIYFLVKKLRRRIKLE